MGRLAAIHTEVVDSDGLVRFTLGDDGRLLTLFIDDAMRTSLTNLGLERKLNDLLSAGNEAMQLSRKQFGDGVSAARGSGKTEELWSVDIGGRFDLNRRVNWFNPSIAHHYSCRSAAIFDPHC